MEEVCFTLSFQLSLICFNMVRVFVLIYLAGASARFQLLFIVYPLDYSDLQRLTNLLGEFPMDCPLQDSRLSVHYKGMLLNEEKTVFYDSKIDNNDQPLEFSSGEGLVSYSNVYRKT